MRGDAEDLREQPQEMKRAEPELRSGAIEIDPLIRVRVQP